MDTSPLARKKSRLVSVLLIVGLLGLILTSIFLSRRSVNEVQQNSAAIYKDRLIPSGILVNLTSTIYRKRLLLETKGTTAIASTLDRLNRRIDSLVLEFEKTNLTSLEADQLRLLKQQLTAYNGLETDFVASQPVRPGSLPESINTSFGKMAQTLDDLSDLQLTVGETLLSGSRGQTNYIYVLTALQIGMVLIVGLSLFWYRF